MLDESESEISLNQGEKLNIPPNWTILYHGTNLLRPHWLGKLQSLDESVFRIEGMGLSVITYEDQLRNRQDAQRMGSESAYDTTSGYAYFKGGEGQEAEIRVVFPLFNSRRIGYEEIVEEYTRKYGAQVAEGVLKLSDKVHWNNSVHGAHPLLPRGMVLQKLSDTTKKGRRVMTYVPQELSEVYNKEGSQN